MTRLIVPESEDEFDNINLDGVVIDEFELNYSMFQHIAHRTPVRARQYLCDYFYPYSLNLYIFSIVRLL